MASMNLHFGLPLCLLPVLLLVGLTNGRPTNATCAVTHDSEGLHYKIVGENKRLCDRYDWTRMGVVLVNYKEKKSSTEVQQWNDTYLHLRVCMEDIQRNRDCQNEDSVQVVTCPVKCPETFPIPSSTRRRHESLNPLVLLFLLVLHLLACWSR